MKASKKMTNNNNNNGEINYHETKEIDSFERR